MAGGARRLYRRLLQLHRSLPPALRDLGDRYVKEEFRRHKAAEPAEAQRFLREWEASARRLGQGGGRERPARGQAPQGPAAALQRSNSVISEVFSSPPGSLCSGVLPGRASSLQSCGMHCNSRQVILYGSHCLPQTCVIMLVHTQVYVTE